MLKINNEMKTSKIYEVILKRLKFKSQEFITREMLSSVNVEFLKDHFTESIIFNWHAAIAGQGLRTIRYPKDWWQAFKERWFLRKFKEWWPVEYRIIDIYALYPSIAMPDKFTGIHIQETSFKNYS